MNTRLLWHQFRKETREHLWFILGYGVIIAIYTALGVTSLLESAKDQWDRPLIMDNEELCFFITLLPAVCFVPFVAFADPTDSPEAFWLTKPPRTVIVVGGKLLWILAWLLAMPMIAECVVAIGLGGAAKVLPVALDYLWLRGAIILGAFALASVANHPLRLALAAVCIPVFLEFFDAFLVSALGVSLSSGIPYAASIALSWIWIGILAVGATAVAFAQYRWRRPLAVGLPATIAVIVITTVVEHREADVTSPPSIPLNSPFSEVSLRLDNFSIDQGDLSPHGREDSHLHADAWFGHVPHTATVGVVELALNLTINGRQHRIRHFSSDWQRFDEEHRDRRRVFAEIGERLRSGPQQSTSILRGKIRVPLPQAVAEDLNGNPTIEVTGTARVDCFDHQEFGILKPPPHDGPTFPPSNRRVRSLLQKDDILLTMFWPVAPANQRHVPVQIREIATASLCPENAKLWTRSHNHVTPWYFVPRNAKSNTVWSQYDEQSVETHHASPRMALHLNRAWFSIPTSFPADEIVVFKARFVGQRDIAINTRTTPSL